MAHDEWWRMDATAQAALVRAREVSALELVDAAIARSELLNPRINAVVTPMFESARRQARDGDFGDGPFAGVPLLLKDASLEVDGTPYYLGTRLLRDIDYRSPRTTEVAHRFRRAGFIFIGKTNVPELSSDITTEPAAFGPTRNPWDLTRSAGGSSCRRADRRRVRARGSAAARRGATRSRDAVDGSVAGNWSGGVSARARRAPHPGLRPPLSTTWRGKRFGDGA